MKSYQHSHLTDQALGKVLVDAVRHELDHSAVTLSVLAEYDLRRLYLPAGYPSMLRYCIGQLHMSDDSALKRIRAARVAREHPAIYPALADGRLNLSAVVMLKPHLTVENAEELLAAAAHRSNAEVALLLAERFPRPDVPTMVTAIAPSGGELAVRPVEVPALELAPGPVDPAAAQLAARPVDATNPQVAVRPVGSQSDCSRLVPLAPGRFALQVTVDEQTHDQLRYAQSLLGHAVRRGDVAAVLKRAIDALVRELEKQKFGRGARTRPRRGSANPRYVPADMCRTVWQRDGGQCTFVSVSGRRCEESADLEFDHIEPLARGGRTVASNLRLRCCGHNQYEAEQAFGGEFMRAKRQRTRDRAAQAKTSAQADAQARAEAEARAAAVADVIPALRRLGFKAEEARRGAAHAAHLGGAPLEQRLRVALMNLAPPCKREPAPLATGAS